MSVSDMQVRILHYAPTTEPYQRFLSRIRVAAEINYFVEWKQNLFYCSISVLFQLCGHQWKHS